jgi:glycosyltransferase involved in cell wall biosynthesis
VKIEFTLHDAPSSNAGGMGVTVGLSDVYRRLGNDVGLLCFADLPDWMTHRVKSIVFPGLVAKELRNAEVDVIDAAIGDGWLLARFRSGGRRTPLLVCRSHGMAHLADKVHREEAKRGALKLSWKYPLYWGGLRLTEEAMALRSADLCLFLNEQERTVAVDEIGVDPAKARVVDNGLPRSLIGLPLPPLPLSENGTRIAHIGSYLEHKGTRYLVVALQRLLEGQPDLSVTLLGTVKDREAVLAGFDGELRRRITVVPSFERDELASLLAGHTLVLSASLREGFPLGTLEAMACGLVPVVSNIPGPTQYVTDGRNGLVVPAADGAALAAGVERLIDDADLLERLRGAAHQTAQSYSWDRIGRGTLDLYAEAIDRVRAERRTR